MMTKEERTALTEKLKATVDKLDQKEDRYNEILWNEIDYYRQYAEGQAMRRLLIEILSADDPDAKLRFLAELLGDD